jgi:phosphatidylglycerophosphate synthase
MGISILASHGSTTVSSKDSHTLVSDGPSTPVKVCVVGKCSLRLFGLTMSERFRRQVAAERQDVRFIDESEIGQVDDPLIIVRSDAVIDTPLVSLLLEQSNLLLLSSDSRLAVAAHVAPGKASEAIAILADEASVNVSRDLTPRSPADLKMDFWKSLRKRETPYAFRVTDQTHREIEWRIFMGTYKGATDIVTKHLWPRPAFLVTRWLAPRGISPNMVTFASILLVFLAFYLFLSGSYFFGLLAAWLMTFLDTVDGKLARTTLTSSKWGDVLDHGVDLVHPPFWYIAWAVGLGSSGIDWSSEFFMAVLSAILGGYVLQRIMEGIAIKWLGLEIHIWRPIDTLFRQITARRNPNLIILTVGAIAARPDLGLIAVAIWTVACLLLHLLQLVQALVEHRSSPLTSWMSESR